ncbi:MAG: hypothetical protein CM1200mP18_23050 [Gammaproteobacteria bacterium]|nr:MAG: hypothetical protein CM1200mP18_23050 [Gammaproteobacteria bacterium]
MILIHGLGGTLNIWDSIASVLERRFSVLRYDLRGHGRSDVPAGDWSLEDFGGDLEAIFVDECLSQAHLVGFSLGGLIVQQFALSYPERVGQLAILSAVAGRTDAERERVQERLHNLEKGDLEPKILSWRWNAGSPRNFGGIIPNGFKKKFSGVARHFTGRLLSGLPGFCTQ